MELRGHYKDYWRRMAFREEAQRYRAPCLDWYHTKRLNPAEEVVFERVKGAGRLLDFGAGDLRLKEKFLRAGFRGRYETLDLSEEFPHDYTQIGDVRGRFAAILCLEVIEHMPLASFDPTVTALCDLLEPGGMAVISTPYHGYLKNLALALAGGMDTHFTALWDHGHIKFWSVKTLTELFREQGLNFGAVRRVGRLPALAKSMILTFHKS